MRIIFSTCLVCLVSGIIIVNNGYGGISLEEKVSNGK
jgi:hypothetical protein